MASSREGSSNCFERAAAAVVGCAIRDDALTSDDNGALYLNICLDYDNPNEPDAVILRLGGGGLSSYTFCFDHISALGWQSSRVQKPTVWLVAPAPTYSIRPKSPKPFHWMQVGAEPPGDLSVREPQPLADWLQFLVVTVCCSAVAGSQLLTTVQRSGLSSPGPRRHDLQALVRAGSQPRSCAALQCSLPPLLTCASHRLASRRSCRT